MLEIVTSRLHNIPKTVAILLGSFAVFVVLYAKSMDLPITFLGILFLTSLVLMTFLPSKIEVATLLIIAIMGTIAAFISPINDIPDERVDVYKRQLQPKDRDMVEAYVSLLTMSLTKRLATLKTYGFRKNRAFHTLVFWSLVITLFGYRRK